MEALFPFLLVIGAIIFSAVTAGMSKPSKKYDPYATPVPHRSPESVKPFTPPAVIKPQEGSPYDVKTYTPAEKPYHGSLEGTPIMEGKDLSSHAHPSGEGWARQEAAVTESNAYGGEGCAENYLLRHVSAEHQKEASGLRLSPKTLLQAVVFSEILGKPLSKR